MNPADRRARRSSLRKTRPLDAFVLVAIGALGLGLAMPWLSRLWQGSADGPSNRLDGMTGEEEVLAALIEVAREKALEHVVLQLDREAWSGGGSWPDQMSPWGHVPEFTLFDDGTVVYLGAYGFETWVPLVAHLDAEEADRLVEEVVALGFDRLSSDEDQEVMRDNGELQIIADGGYDNLFLRRGDSVQALRLFEVPDARNAQGAQQAIVTLLVLWTAPTPVPLQSNRAILYREDELPSGRTFWATPVEDAIVGDTPSIAAYPGRIDEGVAPAYVVGWPDNVPMPTRFPAIVSSEALSSLRATLPGGDGAGGSFAARDPDTDTESSRAAELFRETGRVDASVARASAHWGWTFRLPHTDGSTRETRVIAVPWIYGDRYPKVERDIEDYARALEAADVARRDADATAIAVAPANRERSDVRATLPPLEGYADSFEDPMVAEAPWNPFPPEFTPDPLPFGLGIQVWEHWTNDGTEATLRRLSEETAPSMGWLKQRFAWADLEPFGPTLLDDNPQIMHPDRWLAAVSRNEPGRRRVLVQLDVPPNWARNESPGAGDPPFDLTAWAGFVREFANRYAGLVEAYEIMNEPNLAQAWGAEPDPAAYAKVLAAAFRAIKMADPGAVVLSAGLAPTSTQMPIAMDDVAFLEQLYDAMDEDGGSALYFDALGAHAAGFSSRPEISPDEAASGASPNRQRYATFRRVEDLRRIMVARGDEAKQIVVTEFGWSTEPRPEPFAGSTIGEDVRAEYIRAAHEFARGNWSPWIGPMILFTAADPAWTPDHEAWWWSVTEPGGGLRQEIRDAFAAP